MRVYIYTCLYIYTTIHSFYYIFMNVYLLLYVACNISFLSNYFSSIVLISTASFVESGRNVYESYVSECTIYVHMYIPYIHSLFSSLTNIIAKIIYQ